jgi:hypothetical protein
VDSKGESNVIIIVVVQCVGSSVNDDDEGEGEEVLTAARWIRVSRARDGSCYRIGEGGGRWRGTPGDGGTGKGVSAISF